LNQEGIDFQTDIDFRIISDKSPYRILWPNLDIEITFKYTRDKGDDTRSELWVDDVGPSKGHILWGTVSLNLPDSITRFVNKLQTTVPDVPWEKMLRSATTWVINRHRTGVPEVQLSGNMIPPQGQSKSWMIRPILEPKNTTIVYGPGSVGKSMFCLYLAVLAHRGISTESLEIDRPFNVLYLDWETSLEEIADRVRIINKGLGLELDELGIWYKKMDFGLAKSLEEVREIVVRRNIDIIVLDSMGYAAAGELESSQSARELHASLRSLDISALCIHHISKESMSQGRNSVAKPFGSIYYENMARHTFELKKEQGEEEDYLEIGMYDRKANNVRKIAPIGWEIQFLGEGDVTDSVTFTKRAIHTTRLRDTVSIQEQIQRLLEEEGPKSRSEIAEHFQLPPDRISKELSSNKSRFQKSLSGRDLWESTNFVSDEPSTRTNLGDV
jgi:hypothetical protein